jgi:hypothetical protein
MEVLKNFKDSNKFVYILLQSIYIKVNICMYVCMYVCMFRHNYLSVNGIVSSPSFNSLYKYKEEHNQGEMWHSAQRVEISEEIMYVLAWPLPGNSYVTHIHGNQQ